MKATLIFKNDTISLHKDHQGYWLYDQTRGMNLAMKAKTEQDAYITALIYYQKALAEVGKSYSELVAKVDGFVGQFIDDFDTIEK